MIPKFVAWEYWENGLPEFVPARWVPGEAWALIKDAWTRVDSAEVGNEGRVLDEPTFNKSFAKILIPLPATAFQRAVTAAGERSPAKFTRESLEALGCVVPPNDGKGFVIGGVRSSTPSKRS